MRALRTLLLGAVLSAIALAMSNPAAHGKDAAAHLATLVEALPSTKHFLHHPRNKKHLSHLFSAKQTVGTCDTAAFAEATSKVVQACPSLSGLVSGTTAPEEFLPTFCQSECYQVLSVEFKKNRGCIDGQTLFLVGMVSMCESRPHCYTKAIITEQTTFQKDCEAGITAIGNVTSIDTADLAATTCAGTCRTRLKDIYTAHPECMTNPEGIPTPYAPIGAMLEFMCGEVGGVRCTTSLRGVARLNCNSATCSNSKYWCAASGTTCNINPSSDNLKSMCNSCMDGLIMMADAPGMAARDAIKTVASKELLCGRVNPADSSSNLCYPTAVVAFATGKAAMAANFTSTVNDNMCSGDNMKCLPRTLGLMATMAQMTARDTFQTCVSTATKSVTTCQPELETALANAELLRTMSTLVCEDNRLSGSYNLKCLTAALQIAGFVQSGCHATCSVNTTAAKLTCNSTANMIYATMGCCGVLADPFISAMMPTVFQGNFLPAGTQTVGGKTVTFSSSNANSGSLDRTKRPLNSALLCQTATTDTAALWTTWESKCPARSTTQDRTLKIYASYERANAKTSGLMRKFVDALRTDMAVNLGVPVNYILNAAVAEDSTIKVNLRVKGSRRQVAAGTGNGMKLTFSIDGATTTEVATSAALFDARVSAGTLYTSAAASVLQDECTDCADAYSSSMVRATVQQTTAAPGTYVTTAPAGSASTLSSALFAVATAVLAVVVLA